MDDFEHSTANHILEFYLFTEDEAKAEIAFIKLFENHSTPITNNFFKRKINTSAENLNNGFNHKDAEDCAAEAHIKLAKALRKKRLFPSENKIRDFESYVIGICKITLIDFWRRRHQEIFILQNSLRYLLNRADLGFVYWRENNNSNGCGLAQQTTEYSKVPTFKIVELVKDSRLTYIRDDLFDLVTEIFRHASGWLNFKELVEIVATLRGIEDIILRNLSDDEDLLDEQGDFLKSAEKREEDFIKLSLLWTEINELSRFQRLALLLSMRDKDGLEEVSRFLETKVATPTELEKALEIGADQLEKTLGQLPLSDKEIMNRIGAESVVKVANLRKVARNYLARRLDGIPKRLSREKGKNT